MTDRDGRTRGRSRNAGTLAAVGFGLLLGFLLAESLLRVYMAVVETPRADARGFRNAEALQRAEIVAVGDSVTYGYNVPAADAWPQQLGRIEHRSVYQIAVGGWGPGNYFQFFDLALSLRPSVLIVAYYLGNDLTDAYALVYHRANFRDTAITAMTRVVAYRLVGGGRKELHRPHKGDSGVPRNHALDAVMEGDVR